MYREKIKALRDKLSENLFEKDEAIALGLLCLLAGKSIFFYGPPGTAKSLVARRISKAFKSDKFFDYLMNRFSTPEEIFGPLSLKNLREDKLVRKTEGFLPEADFAFLDEIWKSSPAILNALLTIINEKKFRNVLASDKSLNPQGQSQEELDKVPLKGLIAASNELPQKGQSLEALYDRFIMRLEVARLESQENFIKLLQGSGASADVMIDEELKFSNEELEELKQKAKEASISEDALVALATLKGMIEGYNESARAEGKALIDVSERRWVNIIELLKMACVLSDRTSVELSDLILLKHCLWSELEQKEYLNSALDAVTEGLSASFEDEDDEYENLKKEIRYNLSYQEPKYENEIIIDGKKYIKTELKGDYTFIRQKDNKNKAINIKQTYYMEPQYDKRVHTLYYINDNGCLEASERYRYIFIDNTTIQIYVAEWAFEGCAQPDARYTDYIAGEIKIKLPIKIPEGTKKEITSITQKAFLDACENLRKNISAQRKKIAEEQDAFKNKYHNSFLNDEDYIGLLKGLKEADEYLAQKLIEVKKLESEVENAKVKDINAE